MQHTYYPGNTSRRFYARISNKFLDNTNVSSGGKSTYGSNRSPELSDELSDGCEHIMTQSFECTYYTDALFAWDAQPKRFNDFTVTSAIYPDAVSAVLKKLKRGNASGPDEVSITFYRDYTDALAPILDSTYTR